MSRPKTLPNTQTLRTLSYAVLALGLCVRVLHALSSDRMIYPDEHFQSLEPANFVVNGIGWLAWEWQMGARNWLVPALFTPVLSVLRWFGITGGTAAIASCRLLMAVLSSLACWQIYRLLKLRGLHPWAILLALTGLSLFAPMVVWSDTTLSETFASALVWIAMPWLLTMSDPDQSSRPFHFCAGLVCGLIVALRYQMVLWIAPLLLLIWIICRPNLKKVTWVLLGLLTSALALGLLDYVTWGRPFHSIIVYLKVNLVDGLANQHGVSPWYEYLRLIYEQAGWLVVIPILISLSWALRWPQPKFQRMDAIVLIPALSFAVLHSLLAHKELRFISPFFPAIFYGLAVWIQALIRLGSRSTLSPAWHNMSLGLFLTALVGLSFWTIRDADDDRFYMFYDMNAVARAMAEDGGLLAEPDTCVALYQSHWIWTRGDMQQNTKVRTVAFDASNSALFAKEWQQCRYTLVYRGWLDSFRALSDEGWQLIFQSPAGDGLFKQTRSKTF